MSVAPSAVDGEQLYQIDCEVVFTGTLTVRARDVNHAFAALGQLTLLDQVHTLEGRSHKVAHNNCRLKSATGKAAVGKPTAEELENGQR
jgi:hypothetical protein